MTIRKAKLEDLQTLVEFTAQEAEEAEGISKDRSRLTMGIETALKDPSIASYWIMLDASGNSIASISAIREWSDWNAGYYWWIQSMYIVPKQRGKGHIAELVDTVAKEMHDQNGLELRLYVHEDNQRAVKAYEKIGFEMSPYEIMVRKVVD